MSASEKLRALYAEMDSVSPNDLDIALSVAASAHDLLPALADVVEAAEDFGFMEASLAAAGIYGEPERLRAALSALNEALGGDVT